MRSDIREKKVFFLRFLDKSSEEEFKEIFRKMNNFSYRISVTEKPSTGIWEVQKVEKDEGGLGSFISKFANFSKTEQEDTSGDAFRVLLGKYISRPCMKQKVVFNFNEYQCCAGKNWLPEAEKMKLSSKEDRNDCEKKKETIVVQFPNVETA